MKMLDRGGFLRKAILAICLLASCFLDERTRAAELPPTFFREKVQPILEQHCYKCHSSTAEKIKGGLLLDSREDLLRGGDTGHAINPGDPDSSKLVIAVRHTDPDLQMPPKEKLSDAEIKAIEDWVRAGAVDPRVPANPTYRAARELWAAKPVILPNIPEVKERGWVKDPVDALVLAQLEKHKLRPVRAATKEALIRRATFDLTGLPPTPGEIDAFVRDMSENAFAIAVDRLLKSPHFGERWGRHWLDLARYADSNGLDRNTLLNNAWRYRDYVVGAFNEDKPYNEFVREQLAGDLLPFKDNEDRHSKWIATGFLVLGPKNFGEPNREKLLMDIADEQIDVTSRAFLGLTVSCARCHDHKFDPIPSRDYYALAGIFRSTQTLSAEERGARDGAFLSERPLGSAAEAERVEAYQKKLGELEQKRDRARQMARELPGGIDSKELDGIVLDNLEAELTGEWKLSNYSTNFVDKNYVHDGAEKAGKGKKSVRFRPPIPESGLYEIRLAYTARANRATNVPVRVQSTNSVKTVFLNQTVEPKYDKAFETLGFFRLERGTNNLIDVLTEGTRGYVVVDAVQCLPQDVQLAAKLTRKRSLPPDGQEMMMSDVSAARRQEYEDAVAELMGSAPPPMPMALAVRDGEVRNVRVLLRGDPEHPGEEVPRGFLSIVEHVQSGALRTDSSGRLALANWIAHENNPLTARVMVNRIWLHLFGRGLVNTPDNFGSMGELPSNPELLDYLAAQYVADGWSTKRMIKRLMLTATYQLSSAFDPAAFNSDPDNRYSWRMTRKRLEVEALRDSVLALNGTLDPRVGGESLEENGGSPDPNGARAQLTSRRRSLYLPVFRGNLNEMFQVFDFPDPHALSGKRYTTTAATQALFLMNSPFAADESRKWAEALVKEEGKGESELVNEVYLSAYGRRCDDAERTRAMTFLKDFGNAQIAGEPDAARRRFKALQAFCQAMIESTEFRYLN